MKLRDGRVGAARLPQVGRSPSRFSNLRAAIARRLVPGWIGGVGVLIGIELLFLLYLHVAASAGFELGPYRWISELMLGRAGEHPGVLRPLLLVNLLAVLALWVGSRSRGGSHGRGRPVCIAAAIVLAAVSVDLLLLARRFPPLEAVRVVAGEDPATDPAESTDADR